MQDFLFDRTKVQEAAPEPYTLYNKEQTARDMVSRNESIRDIEYFRSMYPMRVKSLQLIVEEIFDGMDYEASPIYDEFPDRILVEQLFRRIRTRVGDENTDAIPEGMQASVMQEPVVQATETQMGRMDGYGIVRAAINEPVGVISADESLPHMPYGPRYIIQSVSSDNTSYRTWEMEEGAAGEPPERPGERQTERIQEMDRVSGSWGPPNPWGPPPPPPRPWGPPPPNPWGPPPPPRPWGPPPPPNPWGPPGRLDMDDIIRLLLFGEMQKRRCNGRNCR